MSRRYSLSAEGLRAHATGDNGKKPENCPFPVIGIIGFSQQVINPRGYVVMTSARCGATYLSQAIGSTGSLGRPEDWFNGIGYRNRGVSDYPMDREGQLEKARTDGMSANGIYALKMSVTRCDELRGFDWASRLAPLSFIHLGRRDRLARAISDVMSRQTGQYRSTSAVKGERRYDAGLIRKALSEHAMDEARIHQYFALNDITPLTLAYEDLSGDVSAVLHRIADFLGVADVSPPDMTQVTLAVQRDGLNAEWKERYLAENGEPNIMPPLTGRLSLFKQLIG